LRRSVIARDRLQHVVIDQDQLRRILGHIAVGGNDAGDRVAMETYLVHRQRGHPGRLQPLDRRRHFQAAGPLVDFMTGYHCDNAGHRFRLLQVEAGDARMGVRRAHEANMQRTRNFDIVDISSLATQQAWVLLARDRLADLVEVMALRIFRFDAAHLAASSRSISAAFFTALTMFP
jgi:hypothetical protein